MGRSEESVGGLCVKIVEIFRYSGEQHGGQAGIVEVSWVRRPWGRYGGKGQRGGKTTGKRLTQREGNVIMGGGNASSF